ncbi:MAG: response regulator [Pseudonocardiaceae bacterium]
MIRVVVADDEPLARDGLAALIGSAPDIEVIATAANGADAVQLARDLAPDVVVMDVRMPVLDGIAATAKLLTEVPARSRPRVLVLTTFDLDEYVYDALVAGASGFLLKDAGAAELVRAVRLVAAGEALLAPSVTRRLIEEFTQRRRPTTTPGVLEVLTARERDVLAAVARGLSNAEVASELVVAEETVKTHVSRILSKLGLRDRAQAIVAAYNAGLVVPRRRTPPH